MARIVGVILSDLDWLRLEQASKESQEGFSQCLRTMVGPEVEDLTCVHLHWRRRTGRQWLQVERPHAA